MTTFEFITTGCLGECDSGVYIFQLDEQPNIAGFPAEIEMTLINSQSESVGGVGGKRYFFEYDETLIFPLAELTFCDLGKDTSGNTLIPACKTCATTCELDARVTVLEALVDENTEYTFDFSQSGDDLVVAIAGTDGSTYDKTLTDAFLDTDTIDVSQFEGSITGGIVTLTHTANGVAVPVQFPLGVSSVSTASQPDGSTIITYVDGAGVTQTAGVIPAGDISSVTQVTNADGSITNTHTANGVSTSWVTNVPVIIDTDALTAPDASGLQTGSGDIADVNTNADSNVFSPSGTNLTEVTSGQAIRELASFQETGTSNFQGSDTSTFDRNVGDQTIDEFGYNADTYGDGVANGQDFRIGRKLQTSGLDSDYITTAEQLRGNVIRVNAESGSDDRTYTINGEVFTSSVYDNFRPWATAQAAYNASETGDTILTEGDFGALFMDRDIDILIDATRSIGTTGRITADAKNSTVYIKGRPNFESFFIKSGSVIADMGEGFNTTTGTMFSMNPANADIGRVILNFVNLENLRDVNFGAAMIINDNVSFSYTDDITINVENNASSISYLAVQVETVPVNVSITIGGDVLSVNSGAIRFRNCANYQMLIKGDVTAGDIAIASGAASIGNITVMGTITGSPTTLTSGTNRVRGVIDVDASSLLCQLTLECSNIRSVGEGSGSVIYVANGAILVLQDHTFLYQENTAIPASGNTVNPMIQMVGSTATRLNRLVFTDGFTSNSLDPSSYLVEAQTGSTDNYIWSMGESYTDSVNLYQFPVNLVIGSIIQDTKFSSGTGGIIPDFIVK